ncbi:unnamed protein product [Ilex paraguariensis]|uniref:Uncharacterized protein n=1 Tax=Ilex paraguariensis TaxID=185542 RepID=A0ABC8S1A8_9AQUA
MSIDEVLTTAVSTINQLTKYENKWNLKVKVLRRGSITTYSNNKGTREIWKVILVDEEGTRIQALMFSNVVTKFSNLFIKDKTYFVSNDAVTQPDENMTYDIIGFVIEVKSIININKDGKGPPSNMREVVLKNNELYLLRLTLWGDLAKNEGQILEQLLPQKPIIATSQANGSIYEGEFRLTTTSITTIEINPELQKAKQM